MTVWYRWLLPGLQIKRWLLLFSAGVFLMGLGISLAVQGNLYARVEEFLFRHVQAAFPIVQFYPVMTSIVVMAVGALLSFIGMLQLVRSILHTLAVPREGVAEAFYQRRALLRGPRVVAVGGGTGIPTLLRGMKEFTANLTAVITVADDGGSSGRLRTQFGILPPGDIRNCLVALADTEPLMEKLFQHRFSSGEGLAGHPFGNLFILAMSEATGDFYDAVRASSQVLAVRGRVMPATLEQVMLRAELADGRTVIGETAIGKSPAQIKRVFLETMDGNPVAALPDSLEALEAAHAIVLGPGSLYTSVLPNLLVPGIADAIRRSRALKIYVCNIMTQPGETDQYTVSDHVQALIDHAGYGIVDICLANSGPIPDRLLKKYLEQQAQPVRIDPREVQRLGVELIQAELLDRESELVRHDPTTLATQICRLVLTRRGHQERTPWDFFWVRQRLQQQARGRR
jgi:uncharacterized cofD-like protein